MVPQGSKAKSTTTEAFDFNDNIQSEDTIVPRNMQYCEQVDELESMDPSRTEDNMANAHITCRIFGVDSLQSSLSKRKYSMTQCIRNKKKPWRTGSCRSEKVSLANVQ